MHSVRQRHGICVTKKLSSRFIVMDSHAAEIVPKVAFHGGARTRIQSFAGRAQHFIQDGRHIGVLMVERGWLIEFALQRSLFTFLAAFFAFTCRSDSAAAGAFALKPTFRFRLDLTSHSLRTRDL